MDISLYMSEAPNPILAVHYDFAKPWLKVPAGIDPSTIKVLACRISTETTGDCFFFLTRYAIPLRGNAQELILFTEDIKAYRSAEDGISLRVQVCFSKTCVESGHFSNQKVDFLVEHPGNPMHWVTALIEITKYRPAIFSARMPPTSAVQGALPSPDNYDSVMRIDVTTPDYFRMLTPRAIRGLVYDVDIEAGYIIRADGLLQDLKRALFQERQWVILSGSPGFSKTTMTKVIAHDAYHDKMHVVFANHVKEIMDLVATIRDDPDEWLIVIDDIHRHAYGKIEEKLGALVPLLDRANVHVLTTSRVSLEGIKDQCKLNVMREQETCAKLAEIVINEYEADLERAKRMLAMKYLIHLEEVKNLPHDVDMDYHVNMLLKRFGVDFVTIGFALRATESPSRAIDEAKIVDGIRAFLHSEVEEMEGMPGTPGTHNAVTILRALIGSCYEALCDEFVTVDHFDHSQPGGDTRDDMWRALNAAAERGLLIAGNKFEKDDEGNAREVPIFNLTHARVAKWYFKALNHDYKSRYILVSKEKMFTLTQFNNTNLTFPFELTDGFKIKIARLRVENDDAKTAENVQDWTLRNFTYTLPFKRKYRTAMEVVKAGNGCCGEVSNLLIGILRHFGIPSGILNFQYWAQDRIFDAVVGYAVNGEVQWMDIAMGKRINPDAICNPMSDARWVKLMNLWRRPGALFGP